MALNLELEIPLDTIFESQGLAVAEAAFDLALENLDIRLAHCTSRLDHTYLTSQVRVPPLLISPVLFPDGCAECVSQVRLYGLGCRSHCLSGSDQLPSVATQMQI